MRRGNRAKWGLRLDHEAIRMIGKSIHYLRCDRFKHREGSFAFGTTQPISFIYKVVRILSSHKLFVTTISQKSAS